MQFTGAYKVRGAYYKISTLTDDERARHYNPLGDACYQRLWLDMLEFLKAWKQENGYGAGF